MSRYKKSRDSVKSIQLSLRITEEHARMLRIIDESPQAAVEKLIELWKIKMLKGNTKNKEGSL